MFTATVSYLSRVFIFVVSMTTILQSQAFTLLAEDPTAARSLAEDPTAARSLAGETRLSDQHRLFGERKHSI